MGGIELEKIGEYLGNSLEFDIFKKMLKEVSLFISSENNKVLDIASDKDPAFSSMLARTFPNSSFIHFKDDSVRIKKVKPKYSNIENLEIVYSRSNLRPPYDIAFTFFTLHELRSPKKSLKKVYKMLKENGKIILVDYDLQWFPKLAKEQDWGKDESIKEKYNEGKLDKKQKRILEKRRLEKIMKENFEKYIFITKNEKKVLREEVDCVSNHTRWGLEDYVGVAEQNGEFIIRKKSGFRDLLSKSYEIETPWGKRPKAFLYVGKKI